MTKTWVPAGARALHSSSADLTIGDHSHVIEAGSAKSLQFKPAESVMQDDANMRLPAVQKDD
jgi:hypothetical protein